MAGTQRQNPSHSTARWGDRAIDLARNAAILLLLWFVYSWVRSLTIDNWSGAYQNAAGLLNWQDAVGLPSEARIQDSFIAHPPLIKAANRYYMWVHFPATLGFLLWAWHRHSAYFTIVRATLVSVTVTALGLHVLFPLAPPRFMTTRGFVDTGVLFGPSPYELSAAEATNQIAAMPSLHVGWAVLVALSVIAISTNPYRYLVLVHPIITFSVVVVTANHYWSDGFVAAGLVVALWAAFRRIYLPRITAVDALNARTRSAATAQADASVRSNYRSY